MSERRPHDIGRVAGGRDDPLEGEDVPLALNILYELHYRSWDDVDDRWEWEPSLITLRRELEDMMEAALAPPMPESCPPHEVPRRLVEMLAADGPSLSRRLARAGTLNSSASSSSTALRIT